MANFSPVLTLTTILELISLVYSVSARQQPLGYSTSSNEPNSKYSFKTLAHLSNGDLPYDTYNVNVGDNLGITYMVQVLEDGVVVCEQNLQPTGPPSVEPPTSLLQATNYNLDTGSVIPNTFAPSNPFEFVPWYGGEVNIVMEGLGCEEYYPGVWTVESTLVVAEAQVTPNNLGCPVQPFLEDGYLRWGPYDSHVMSFDIDNQLQRAASYGVVQTITEMATYIISDGHYFCVTRGPTAPILDLLQDTVAYPTLDIQNGTSNFLDFLDGPAVILGSGNWTSPSTNDGKYQSVGFVVKFQTFVLQDWDKNMEMAAVQVPIGGDSVVQWSLRAQADLSELGEWTIDPSKNVAQQPTVVTMPRNFAPSWVSNTKDKAWDLADYFGPPSNFWEFEADPTDCTF